VRSAGAKELASLARASGIPTVPNRDQSVWADADPYPEEPFEALLEAAGSRYLVALDGVTDVGNLGSIARSADAAGFSGLLLEQRNAPPIGTGALRASSGALEYLRVGRAPNLGRALDVCAAEGLGVLVADPGGVPFPELPGGLVRGELVWVFGSEERGVRQGIRDRATFRVGIPQAGRVGSLGVAAAAAYLLLRTHEERARVGPTASARR
jgi:23S rRNA (guanosine2251-2'-O)-methyltransferase